jgi:hypothetical protein
MKAILLTVLICICQQLKAQPDAVVVTTQSIKIPGTLTVSAWKNQHNNQEYPDYPKMYYAFAEEDEIVVDMITDNKKGTQSIEVKEYESNSVVYSNTGFHSLVDIRIKVPKTAVYSFEFATNHLFDRTCKVIIKRISASETTRNFNCNVRWKTISDTAFNIVEERRKTGTTYTAVSLQTPIDYYVNSGSNASVRIGKSRITFPIILPENTFEWYYTIAATRNKEDVSRTKSGMKLVGELTTLLTGVSALSFGLDALTQPPGADYCDVFLLTPDDVAAFERKDDSNWHPVAEGTRQNVKSGIVKMKNCCTTGTYYIGLRNPDQFHGVSILIEVVAITESTTYETLQVKKPISVETRKVPVIGI